MATSFEEKKRPYNPVIVYFTWAWLYIPLQYKRRTREMWCAWVESFASLFNKQRSEFRSLVSNKLGRNSESISVTVYLLTHTSAHSPVNCFKENETKAHDLQLHKTAALEHARVKRIIMTTQSVTLHFPEPWDMSVNYYFFFLFFKQLYHQLIIEIAISNSAHG